MRTTHLSHIRYTKMYLFCIAYTFMHVIFVVLVIHILKQIETCKNTIEEKEDVCVEFVTSHTIGSELCV